MFGVGLLEPAAGTLTVVWPEPGRNVTSPGLKTPSERCKGYWAVMTSLRVENPAPVGMYVTVQVDWLTGAPDAVFKTRKHEAVANPL